MNDASVDNKWIGQNTVRPDGVEKVTGMARYGADGQMPGMVWGKVLRSPHGHAIIRSIDTSKAEALNGVLAVMTGADMPLLPIDVPRPMGPADLRWVCRNTIVHERAMYVGHAVAAVAATSQTIADAALALIEVDYEVLPHVIEIEDAIKPDAPVLHDWIRTKGADPEPQTASNIASILTEQAGDVEKGFAAADVIVERSFKTAPVHQAYIEPQACLAHYGKDGQSTVWSSSQGQFMVRFLTAELTGMQVGDIKAIPAEIGGGFGGKTVVYLEPLAMVLSKKCNRPVKMQMSREDVFRGTGPTSGSVSHVKVGVSKDGKITAVTADYYYQAGPFPGSPVGRAVYFPFSSYKIENAIVRGFDVVSNRQRVNAYRAPGAPAGNYPLECLLDEAAEHIGMDPLQLRKINMIAADEPTFYGAKLGTHGMLECIEAIENHPNAKIKLGPNQGRGVAVGYWGNAGGESSAQLHVNEDGTALVITGHPDVGGSRASMVNIAAELLGIDYRRVRAQIGDTNAVGISAVTGGSRVTFAAGLAVHEATNKVIDTLRARAAEKWDIDIDAVDWTDGEARPAGTNAGNFGPLSLADLAGMAGAPIAASASLNATGHQGAFAAHMVDVEVDTETGYVKVLRYTASQDVGRAIHPDYCEGQIQGGVVQGIGWALNEEYIYAANGDVDNAGFLDYRIPVASDLPNITPIIVEVPNDKHPYGVKGVGEVTIVPPLAAITNAVYYATGKRMTELPMSPPKVLAALSK
ncbi:MAG: xanthine dehydrogenase family protein molybdopterin-binding subunit [Alphaproteobacteria bacterium]